MLCCPLVCCVLTWLLACLLLPVAACSAKLDQQQQHHPASTVHNAVLLCNSICSPPVEAVPVSDGHDYTLLVLAVRAVLRQVLLHNQPVQETSELYVA
jgi:hypothetical protein